MIPLGVRLYTWLDFEDALNQVVATESSWPEWLVDVRSYWDGATIRVFHGKRELAREWLIGLFEPRCRETDSDLFIDLLIALETSNGTPREFPVHIEEVETQPVAPRTVPSFSRPTVLHRGLSQVAVPIPFSELAPSVFAFHSFKGGVGRTVHAIALAQLLAEEGHSVLLVDADLEAPGISWLIDRRLPDPPVSLADFLALVHGDSDPKAVESIKLVAARLQDSILNGMFVLPAFRTPRLFHSLDIRPEHVLQGRNDPYALLNLLSALGRALGVTTIVIDLRAGLSELAAGALLDPRVCRVFVTNLGGQSIRGTELVLNLIGSRAPSSAESHPLPVVILNQVPSDFIGTDVLTATEERLLTAIATTVVGKDIEASDVLRGPTVFDGGLLTLAGSWDATLAAIGKSPARETVRPLVPIAPLKQPNSTLVSSPSVTERGRRDLAETAQKLVYAEKGEGADFLPISPLRRLSEDHRGRLPISVIVGAKGAGKTFTYLQVVRRKRWSAFVEAVSPGSTSVDGIIFPILQPRSIAGTAAQVLAESRQLAISELGFGDGLDPFAIRDHILGWLGQPLHEGQWREKWLDLIAWAVGFRPGDDGAGRFLSSELSSRNKKLVLVFDGLEDLFQELTTASQERIALRSLLLDVPNWLEQQPDRMIGALVFIRRDMVTSSVVQNSGQLLARYEQYALRWDKVEALRLAAWVAQRAQVVDQNQELRKMEEASLTDFLLPVWGAKLGAERSREARSAEWVLAALSDFRGQVQARDVVRLLSTAAAGSKGNQVWVDRILVPGAVRDAVAECSREKIEEISQESPLLKDIFQKLRNLSFDKKVVPFQRESVELTQSELEFLEQNGVATAEGGSWYMAEIFRRGLDFSLPSGARPRVLALSRRQRASR